MTRSLITLSSFVFLAKSIHPCSLGLIHPRSCDRVHDDGHACVLTLCSLFYHDHDNRTQANLPNDYERLHKHALICRLI